MRFWNPPTSGWSWPRRCMPTRWGPAHQLRLEHKVGSIEVGKHADLIVLENNLFEIPASRIAGTAIAMTMMDGRVTYRLAG